MNGNEAATWPWPDTPPPTLTARIAEVLGDAEASSAGVEAHLEAAGRLLSVLLDQGCSSRDCAIDLLTVDALVTHAFEIAAEDPDSVVDLAQAAMAEIAGLAGPV